MKTAWQNEAEHTAQTDLDRSALHDIREISIDQSLPPLQRMTDYIQRVNDPYTFRVGEHIVHLAWADTSDTIQTRLESLMEQHFR